MSFNGRALSALLVLIAWSLPARSEAPKPLPTRQLNLPPRPAHAVGGRVFLEETATLSIAQREERILEELLSGNVPTFLRTLVAVPVTARNERGPYMQGIAWVTPDYLAIGNDTDFIRVGMTPETAQKLADATATSLPTTSLVNAVYAAAEMRLRPWPIPPHKLMRTNSFLRAHEDDIELHLRGEIRGTLVAGHKKDIVITNRLLKRINKVAIYGWHVTDGEPIQPLSAWHRNTYSDYSHGVRLVHGSVQVGRDEWPIKDVLQHPSLSAMISDEGPLQFLQYDTNAVHKWDRDELKIPDAQTLTVIPERQDRSRWPRHGH